MPLLSGVGVSWGMYKYEKYRGEDVAFAPFALFIGVAVGKPLSSRLPSLILLFLLPPPLGNYYLFIYFCSYVSVGSTGANVD